MKNTTGTGESEHDYLTNFDQYDIDPDKSFDFEYNVVFRQIKRL